MLKIFIVILISGIMVSCELIVIGSKPSGPRIVRIDQSSPLGAIYLFKEELDSNNAMAAAQIFANPQGTKYLAIEKYNLVNDIKRLKRLIKNKPITNIDTDVSNNEQKVFKIEFDYLETVTFKTKKLSDEWYITDISGWKDLTQNRVILYNSRF